MICTAKEIHLLPVEAANPAQKEKIKDNFLRKYYHCSSLCHPNIVCFIGVYYPERASLLPAMLMELPNKLREEAQHQYEEESLHVYQ